MGDTVRFGVSMDSDLVDLLDSLTAQRGHKNRSETLRGLVRQEIIKGNSRNSNQEVIGIVTLLYHVDTRLPRVSVSPYPSVEITANIQLHAEKEIFIKVLVVKGKGEEVHAWADKLLSSPKVIGKLTISATGELYKELLQDFLP